MKSRDQQTRTARQQFPWNTGPSGLGSSQCDWCGRAIYLPAVPCSVEPIFGLMDIATSPGQGERCQWEFDTRVPDLTHDIAKARPVSGTTPAP